MKTLRFFLPVLMLGLVLFLGSCENTGHYHDSSGHEQNAAPIDNRDNAPPHNQGPEYTSHYICPEHHEGSGSDKPGKCPVCGASYVENMEHLKK
ncbi:MAG: heavy metal-binding domain-containing protein [Saprospiraceae bacterium]